MALNAEQLMAIERPVSDILVSAGAGSGKTKVLVERLLRHIKTGTDIGSFLVLTFTKAAAANMKSRLRSALNQELVHSECDHAVITRALAGLDSAHIETLDAYALYLVEKYHDALGLPSRITGGADAPLAVRTLEIIDEVFAQHEASPSLAFASFLRLTSYKTDRKAKAVVRKVLNEIEKLAEPEAFLEAGTEVFTSDEALARALDQFISLIRTNARLMERTLSSFHPDSAAQQERLKVILASLTPISSVKHYDDFVRFMDEFDWGTPSRARDKSPREKAFDKDIADYKKNHWKDLFSFRVAPSEEEMRLREKNNATIASEIMNIVREVYERLADFKKKNALYSFADISHLAIKLVSRKEIAQEIRESTKEIFIDEYQDNSDIQERLIGAIASHNRFLVGDVKQSIYRFRDADPHLFQEKCQEFAREDAQAVINLSLNYRSRKSVLEEVNKIFCLLMSKEAGGVSYDDTQLLRAGRVDYEKAPVEGKALEILTYDPKEIPDLSSWKLQAEAFEALMIARDIKEKVATGYPIFDPKSATLRKARYEDFAILMLTKSRFDLFKQAFDALGVPIDIQRDNDLLDSVELRVITNLVVLVAAQKDTALNISRGRHVLASVLRSFIFRLKDDEVSRILMAIDPFAALHESARGKMLNDCLVRWSALAGEGSLTDLVEAIYHDLSIPALIARLDEPQEADERIKSFLDMVAMLSETGMDLNGFISFLDKLKDAGLVIPVEGAGRDNAQAVRLMSIHKSKGLEFPVIYLADLKHRFNEDDARSTILFAKDYGFALPADTPYGLTPSFKKKLITASLHDEDLSEEIRKLYVALTRAEEKIIIISPNFDPEKSMPAGTAPDFVEVLRAHSFLDFFTLISASLADSIHPLDVSDLAIGAPQVEAQKRTSVPFVLHPELPTREEIEEKVLAPVIPTPGRLRALATGTRLHREVERLDFTRPLAMQISKLALPKSDFKRLMAFASLPLFKHPAQAIYQEHAYDLNGDRGKLDLLIDEADRYIVIDFKLADLDKASYEEQLARYRAYVETLGAKPVETYLYSFSTGELRKIG